MRPADEQSEVLDLLIDRLQHHTPDVADPKPDVASEVARIVQELHQLASAIPVPQDLLAKIERRLAAQVESMAIDNRNEPPDTLLDPRPQAATPDRSDVGTGERASNYPPPMFLYPPERRIKRPAPLRTGRPQPKYRPARNTRRQGSSSSTMIVSWLICSRLRCGASEWKLCRLMIARPR